MGKDVIGSLEGLPGQAADVGKGRSGRYQAISLSNTFSLTAVVSDLLTKRYLNLSA